MMKDKEWIVLSYGRRSDLVGHKLKNSHSLEHGAILKVTRSDARLNCKDIWRNLSAQVAEKETWRPGIKALPQTPNKITRKKKQR